MATDKAPAFQFYPRDFVSDLDTASMSLEELGAYVLLLCYGWLKDGLPDDEDQLLRLLQRPKTRGRTLADVWHVIAVKFPVAGDGRRRNARQEEVRAEQADYRAQVAEHGRRGARARWNGCPSKARAMPEQSASTAKAMPNDGPASASVPVVPPISPKGGDAETAWQQWREAWEADGRSPLPLSPKRRDADYCLDWARRYPDEGWRALQVKQFFITQNAEVRKSAACLGWFLHWVDEIDLALRKAGRRPASEQAA